MPFLVGTQHRRESVTFSGTSPLDGDIDLDVYDGEVLAYAGIVNADDMFECDVSYRPGDPERQDIQLPLLENERIPANRAVYSHIFPLGNYRLHAGKIRFGYAKALDGNSARFEITVLTVGGIL